MDATGLRGLGTLRTDASGCRVHATGIVCGGTLAPEDSRTLHFRLAPANGVAGGATGVIRYALTAPGP